MIGDKLVINDYHRQAAAQIFKEISPLLSTYQEPFAVTVAGESGCGKSETAAVLALLCEEAGYKALVLQQDDYFIYPPRTNHRKRLAEISWVGPREVKLDLVDQHIMGLKAGLEGGLTKPLVDYAKDEIVEEELILLGVKVVIVEGTYTTLLTAADFKVFIDRNYRQTRKARLVRSREQYSTFIEKVLSIEHGIISRHRELANLIIAPPGEEEDHQA